MSADPQRWDRLNAHVGITAAGAVVVVNDPTDMIWHAQGLSRSTIGVEIAGNFCGVEGDKKTLWAPGGGPHVLTAQQIAAAQRLFQWIVVQFVSHAQLWTRVHAHRQAYRSRIGDPGSAIWQQIAIQWIEALDATDGGESWKIGSGRPIPKKWNQNYTGAYYS